jgi:hypothetical protein
MDFDVESAKKRLEKTFSIQERARLHNHSQARNHTRTKKKTLQTLLNNHQFNASTIIKLRSKFSPYL